MTKRTILMLVCLMVVFLYIVASTTMRNQVEEWTLQYATMPPTDDGLREWLVAQPGVRGVEVRRDKQGLHVRYRVYWGNRAPNNNEFEAALKRIGYTDLGGRSWSSSYMGWW
jgi:hypothetical protein